MKPIFKVINKPTNQSFYMEEVNEPYFPDLWHYHPENEIIYIQNGYGVKYVGDSINRYSPGDLTFIGSQTPHVFSSDARYLKPKSHLKSRAICIQLSQGFFEKLVTDIPELTSISHFLSVAKQGTQIGGKSKSLIIKRIEQLPNQTGIERFNNLLIILDLISKSNEIKYLCSPNYTSKFLDHTDKTRLETVFQYVNKNYHKKIGLEEIAAIANLTTPSFCRFFKLRTNLTFSNYINEVRLINACKMLIEHIHTISEICYLNGFNSITNFNRQFKKYKGVSPSEFQLQHSNHSFQLS